MRKTIIELAKVSEKERMELVKQVKESISNAQELLMSFSDEDYSNAYYSLRLEYQDTFYPEPEDVRNDIRELGESMLEIMRDLSNGVVDSFNKDYCNNYIKYVEQDQAKYYKAITSIKR